MTTVYGVTSYGAQLQIQGQLTGTVKLYSEIFCVNAV